MRTLIWNLTAFGLLLISACSSQRRSTEGEIVPAAPTPTTDSTPLIAPADDGAASERARISSSSEPEFASDPAPTPPTESLSDAPEASSADDVIKSVARVLRGAVEGETDDAAEGSKGSVFGSIGRALTKGFQEAAVSEDPSND